MLRDTSLAALLLAMIGLAHAGCVLDRSGRASGSGGVAAASGGWGGAGGTGGAGGIGGEAGAGGDGGMGGAPACGNGVLDAGEICDDGNTADKDGCSAECLYDASASCPPLTTIPLVPSMPITLTDTTYGAGNSISPACVSLANNWTEVAYQFMPSQKGVLYATVSGAFAKNLYVRETCQGADVACQEADAADPASASVPVLSNQNYLVFVDGGVTSVTTQFELTVALYVCGDGIIDITEECDDGGAVDGDGCSATCQVECAGGIQSVDHHCYLFFTDNQNWDGAHNACLALGPGWDLAAITSVEERNFVDDFVNPTGSSWIGGHDMTTEGTFEWTTGELFDINVWDPNEPNDFQGNEDCVEYVDKGGSSNDRFNDEACSDTQDYLCERPPAGG